MKYCSKCGCPCEDGDAVCRNCGEKLEVVSMEKSDNVDYSGHGRSIVLAIIFSIITCGIYGLYWIVKMNDSVNILAGNKTYTSGGVVIVFMLITCGIYGWYWLYKMGENCDRIKGVQGSSGIVYLVLAVFGLSIVSYCLMQDTINKKVGFGGN